MRFHRIPEMKKSKVVRLVQNDNFPRLSVVCLADSLGDTRHRRHVGGQAAVDKAMTVHGNSRLVSLVSGKLVMELLNLKPGKEVGRIKLLVTEFVLNNNLTSQTELEEAILKFGKGEMQ